MRVSRAAYCKYVFAINAVESITDCASHKEEGKETTENNKTGIILERTGILVQ